MPETIGVPYFIDLGTELIDPLDISLARYTAPTPPIAGDGQTDARVLSGEIVKGENGEWRWADEYDLFAPRPARVWVRWSGGGGEEFWGDKAEALWKALKRERKYGS